MVKQVTLSLRFVILIAASLVFSTMAFGTPDVQRMRIPVGSYWISGGGGGGVPPNSAIQLGGSGGGDGSYSLPAFCIDSGRKAPTDDTTFSAFAGNVVVERYRRGRKIDERPIEQAVSATDPWLKLNGNGTTFGSTSDVVVTPLDRSYDYKITVAGLAFAGVDKQDVENLHAKWSADKNLGKVSALFDNLRAVLIEPGPFGRPFAEMIEHYRQDVEWEAFGDHPSGAILPNTPIDPSMLHDGLSKLVSKSFGSDDEVDIEGFFDWIRLATASLPGQDRLGPLAEKLNAIGFAGEPKPVDPGNSAAVLKAFRSVDGSGLLYGIWSPFASARKEKAGSFDDAIRMIAQSRFSEEELTSGRIDIRTLTYFRCAKLDGAGANDDDEKEFSTQLGKVTYLAKTLGAFAEDGRLVKISSRDGRLCFQWIGNSGVETRIFDAEALKREDIAAIAGKYWLIDDSDADLAESLSDLGVTVETAQALALRLAANAQIEVKDKSEDLRIRSLRRGDSAIESLDVSLLNLSSNGDSTVVRLPDGSLVIVDTGLGAGAVDTLRAFVARSYKKEEPIRLVITHTDRDHIGGLLEILKAGIPIDEVIIGTSKLDAARTERVDIVKAAFQAKGYRVEATSSVIHMTLPGVEALINVRRPTSTYDDNLEGWRLYLGHQTEISLYHSTDAAKPNDAGFLFKIVSRGRALLWTDDLSVATLATMTDVLGEAVLRAGFLKWPHHLWFPPDGSLSRETLGAFIKAVAPHTVAFSGVGHVSHDEHRYQDICSYLRATIVKSVRCYWTRDRKANLAFQL